MVHMQTIKQPTAQAMVEEAKAVTVAINKESRRQAMGPTHNSVAEPVDHTLEASI